jgi:hypothetical protein
MNPLKKALLTAVTLISITFTWYGCTKKEDIFISVDTPNSCFKTFIKDENSNSLKESTVALISSDVYFKNCSDSSETISYKWDFGDGTTSEVKSPTHKFSKKGRHKVTLVSSDKNKAFDTLSVVFSVIIGQKNIKTGETANNAAIDIVETNSGFLLLGTTNDQTVYPYVYTSYIMKLDENMENIGIKNYPNGTRFNSISPGHDGNLILTGTTSGNSRNNELIKTSPEGSVLWSKTLGATNEFETVFPTPDKGYILTGKRNIVANNSERSRNVLVKTDASGNVLWEKFMNQDIVMENAYNLVVENDGYVIAGVKRKYADGSYCSYCDSLVIAKINLDGNVIWKNTIEWSINSDNFWSTRTAKMKNGNYNVINSNTRGVYIFSPSGEFLDRRLITYNTFYQATTKEGNLAILQHEWGNGFRASVTSLSPYPVP